MQMCVKVKNQCSVFYSIILQFFILFFLKGVSQNPKHTSSSSQQVIRIILSPRPLISAGIGTI